MANFNTTSDFMRGVIAEAKARKQARNQFYFDVTLIWLLAVLNALAMARYLIYFN